jgi:hypothetical protein
MQPWPGAAQIVFTIQDAIRALDSDFDVWGTSPRFMQDWRWYKSVAQDGIGLNAWAMEEAVRWSPMLLDKRATSLPINSIGKEIEELCRIAIDSCAVAWATGAHEDVKVFLRHVARIGEALLGSMPETARALTDYILGVNQLLAGASTVDMGEFKKLFGRGQQYISFVRR